MFTVARIDIQPSRAPANSGNKQMEKEEEAYTVDAMLEERCPEQNQELILSQENMQVIAASIFPMK